MALYAFLFFVFYFLSIEESLRIQEKSPKADIANILRISNVIFSFILFAFFYNRRSEFKFSKSFTNKSVFLVYLIHPYYLLLGSFIYGNVLHFNYQTFTAINILFNFLYGLVILTLSFVSANVVLSIPLVNELLFNGFRRKRKNTLSRTFAVELTGRETRFIEIHAFNEMEQIPVQNAGVKESRQVL